MRIQRNPLLWAVYSLLLLCTASILQPLLAQSKTITLEDIWEKGTFQTKGGPRGIHFKKDGTHYTTLNDGKIEEFDLRTGQKTKVLFDAKQATSTSPNWKGSIDGYSFSQDESKLLLTVQSKSIYRWSSKAYFFTASTDGSEANAVYDIAKQQYTTFSPDNKKVAFVVDNNIYIKDLTTNTTSPITTDGKINEIINGASDWVYEEEFELVRAFEWSPDGKYLAYLRFDERAVPEMTMEEYNGESYPSLVKFKYPKVGEANALVSAHIYQLETQKTLEINTGAEKEDYLPRITWTPKGSLCITRMNRHQNHLWLITAQPTSGKTAVLMEETNPSYLDLHEPLFLTDGSGFIWQSEKSGFNHLYRYDMKGKEKAALTKGNFDVTAFYGVDEENQQVFYQAAAVSPMQREIYFASLNGKNTKKISDAPGFHTAQFSGNFDYWINSFSTLNDPPRFAVLDRMGTVVRTLEQNERVHQIQEEYGTVPATFFQIPLNYEATEEGGPWNGHLNAFMIRPKNSPEGTKHPVLMFAYGGPGSQQALDQWKGQNYWWFQMLVQQGFVVVCVDNRGTGARGEAFKKATYLQLGKLEAIDQIAAARHIGQLPFIDAAKIGIFGWSFGGYLSSLCLLKGGKTFNSAIAVAPVTNWKWYDSIYTERYMRTHQENPKGYEENSPVNFAELLDGNYMLVHGLTDDNVHFQHSAEMTNELIKYNKQFKGMIYPNRNHGIGDKAARLHLYRAMTQFLHEHLGNPTVNKP